MKTNLCVFVKNPFTQRDFERMGIEELEQNFDVRIFDCTAWLMPHSFSTRGCSKMDLPNLYSISSLSRLRAELNKVTGGIAIDYVGQFSMKAILLFQVLKKKEFKLVIIDSGAFPVPEKINIMRFSLLNIATSINTGTVRRALNTLMRRVMLRVLPDQSPDFALVAGESWRENSRFIEAKNKISAHSFDYEKYLRVQSSPSTRCFDYAVYLDEKIVDHEDNSELGYPAPVTKDDFLLLLNNFFLEFESSCNMPVIVAGYPSQRINECSQIYAGREMVIGETAELVSNAKVVFTHASTSVSFAVLWRRPIVFLTNNELTKSWYYPWIEARKSILKAPMVNMGFDSPRQDEISEWFTINQEAYQHYEETYIKSQNSPKVSLWTIFRRMLN